MAIWASLSLWGGHNLFLAIYVRMQCLGNPKILSMGNGDHKFVSCMKHVIGEEKWEWVILKDIVK